MVGKTISHYEILEKLGQGGMGVVYKGHDTKLDRHVALKFLPPQLGEDDEEKRRFIQEAKAASGLQHNNICTIHEIGETDDGRLFICMDYYRGDTLKQKIEAGLRLDEAIDLALQVAEGLTKAHSKDIVHRDIKPANVIVTDDDVVKILDFGLAKLRGQSKLTKSGTTLGTPAYMSPEQARGEEVDHRADIWSFGVLLYELLSGRSPFTGDYDAAVHYAILHETPEPITRLNSDVSESLEQLIQKALEKDPGKRYQKMETLLADLHKEKPGLSESTVQVDGARTPQKKKRLPTPVLAGLAFIIAIGVFGLYSWLSDEEEISTPFSERKMLVVLPFENLGPPADEYFADGVTEEITSRLSYLPGLSLISRTTAVQYKQTTKSIREIGQELGVDYALAGTIRWQRATGYQGKVRVTPTLIHVADDRPIWSEAFNKTFDEIFEVQANIAEQVARQLDLKLLRPERRAFSQRPTSNMEAYDIYLRALEHYNRGTAFIDETEFQKAIPLFEEAVSLDPSFTYAFIRLFHSHRWQYFRGFDRTDERLSKAKAALDEALRLQPDLPDAQVALSDFYYAFLKDYDRALESFEYARKLNPNIGPDRLANIQRRQGEWKKAVDNYIEAFALNPRTGASSVATSFTFLRQFQEAEKWYDRALSINPNLGLARNRKATNHLYWKGDIDAVEAMLSAAPKNQRLYTNWLLLNRTEIDSEKSLKRLAEISPDKIVDQYRYIPRDLAYAIVFYLMKDLSRMAAHADSARIRLETEIRQIPNDARYHVALGLTYAFLNRKEAAIKAAERGAELYPVSKDAMVGTNILIQLAEVYAVVGEHDLAIDKLEYLLSIPSEISVSWLKYDRFWDVLREHPRFQKLLNAGEFSSN